jgi:two-component system, chemotaxis family, protein-glutamate methylesterase/glutaminase
LICQDEASSVVYGMPKALVDAGLADNILPLIEIQNLLLAINYIYTKSSK